MNKKNDQFRKMINESHDKQGGGALGSSQSSYKVNPSLGNIDSCYLCNSLYNKKESYYCCSKCADKDREILYMVHDYLAKNPNSSILTVMEETHVSMKILRKYIEQGRL